MMTMQSPKNRNNDSYVHVFYYAYEKNLSYEINKITRLETQQKMLITNKTDLNKTQT